MTAFVIACLLLFARAGTTKLVATWSAQTAICGERVELTIRVTGDCAVDAELLEFAQRDDATFEVIEGPTTVTEADGDYACTWRVAIMPTRAGTLSLPVRVRCQSSDEVAIETAPLSVAGGQNATDHGTFELRASAASVFVGEPFTIDLVLRCPPSVEPANAEIELPWFRDVVVLSMAAVERPVVLPIVDAAQKLQFRRDPLANGPARLTAALTLLAPVAGPIAWSASRVRAPSLEPSRHSEPRLELSVETAVPSIDVVALPSANRPANFVDAVGRYRVEAHTETKEVGVGEPFTLIVDVDAEPGAHGNLAIATLPYTWAAAGLRIAQRDDRRAGDVRRLTFEVRAEHAGLLEIPAFAIPTFDPRARAYAVARSEPIPVRVIERDANASGPQPSARTDWRKYALAGAVGVAMFAAFWFARSRRPRVADARPSDPRAAFERGLRDSEPDDPLAGAKALAQALHARCGLEAGALFGAGARSALEQSDLPDELVESIARYFDAAEAAAFSATSPRLGANEQRLDEARGLVEALLNVRR